VSAPTVAQYVVARLAALGVRHVFGVPGDYAFRFNDAIEENPDLTWAGNANELNAAYAADGYARVRCRNLVYYLRSRRAQCAQWRDGLKSRGATSLSSRGTTQHPTAESGTDHPPRPR
jgi:hypothetical protein